MDWLKYVILALAVLMYLLVIIFQDKKVWFTSFAARAKTNHLISNIRINLQRENILFKYKTQIYIKREIIERLIRKTVPANQCL